MMELKEIYCEKISIWTNIPVLEVLDMNVTFEENSHGRLYIKAVIQKDTQDSLFYLNQDIRAVIKESGEILFRGTVENLVFCREGQYLEAEISGCSYTRELDTCKKSRSFQNTSLTYRQVTQEIANTYEGAGLKWNIADGQIGAPIIQYQETDWEFIKRLASRFGEVVYPDLASARVGFHFGISTGTDRSAEEMEVVSTGICNLLLTQEGCQSGAQKKQAAFKKVKGQNVWHIGDFIYDLGRKYTVYRMKIAFTHHDVSLFYELGERGMYRQEEKLNEALTGTYLRGTIRKTEQERVWLQLDIDKEEKSDYGWPWVPETGNLCYCMPEAGTKAALYLPSGEEKQGIAVHIADELGGSPGDVQNREFVTPYQKKLCMYPENIYVKGKQSDVILSDETGIKLDSRLGISMTATEGISVKGNRVLVNAPIQTICKNKQANIELCGDLNFYAPSGVKMQGADGPDLQEETVADGGEEGENWQAAYKALACVPVTDPTKNGNNGVLDMVALGGVATVGKGASAIALSEVMSGKKESETSFPSSFSAMGTYVIKGGYRVPDKEK